MICENCDLSYKVEAHAVVIGNKGQFQTLETRFYTIHPSIFKGNTFNIKGVGE